MPRGRTAGRPRRGCGSRARSSGRIAGAISIASRTIQADSGSSAAVGSSRKMTAGSCSSARTMASFCFMPLLNVADRLVAPLPQGECPQIPLDPLRAGRGVQTVEPPEEVEVRGRRQLFVQPGRLGQDADARRTASASSVTSSPSTGARPRSARSARSASGPSSSFLRRSGRAGRAPRRGRSPGPSRGSPTGHRTAGLARPRGP